MTRRKPCAARPDRTLIEGHSDNTVEAIRSGFLSNLLFLQARLPEHANATELYLALAATVRDRLVQRWMSTIQAITEGDVRTVCYLSAEFLLGPQLLNNLAALGIEAETREALAGLDVDLAELAASEEEPGLGNGGLGRLAACYLDSLATLEIPSIGYGIRYEFGIFDQEIRDGWQVEVTDKWLQHGNPWEIARPGIAFRVGLGGRTEHFTDAEGRFRTRWIPDREVRGIAHDTPIPGYRVGTCGLLRLWKAEAAESFDFAAFNLGDYWGAVDQKIVSENISKVLYPNDELLRGRELRLEQQHFFVSCSLQDMLRLHLAQGRAPDTFHKHFAVQLNDTHPAIAVAELMRLLVDEHGLPWERAWEVSRAALAYTNHTLLPEALEKWPVPLFARLLPRHLEIIYEINRRFLDEVRVRFPGDGARVARMSLIDERGERHVRMAHLAAVGSHAVNGVAALHSELLRREVLRDFAELEPEKFCNVTNGVTPRRFLKVANPRLAALLSEAVGEDWVRDLERLRGLEGRADDDGFRAAWREVKLAAKRDLAAVIRARTGVEVDPASMFDVQVKRIHEYKRQHLNALHVITLYNRIRRDPGAENRAAHRHRRGQGGARLPHGQADHQARQFGGRDGQRRPDRGRPPQSRFPAGFQRDQRPGGLSRRRPVRADLDRRQGGVGNGKYEVGDERRADHRHPRRRERRDPGGGRRRELLPVRVDGRRGRRAARLRLPAARRSGVRRRASGGDQPARRGLFLDEATPAFFSRWSTTCSTRTRSWCSPITVPTSKPRRRPPGRTWTPAAGRRCRSSTPPGRAGFRPTARSASTRRRSGRSGLLLDQLDAAVLGPALLGVIRGDGRELAAAV